MEPELTDTPGGDNASTGDAGAQVEPAEPTESVSDAAGTEGQAAADTGGPAADAEAQENEADDAAPATEAPVDPVFAEWNGQIDTLATLPGWDNLPEAARTAITQRLQTVLTGWQRAYTKKVEQVKQESTAAQADMQQKYDEWLRLVTGEDDPIGTRDATIQKLQAELEAARSAPALGAAWEQEKASLTSQYEEKLAEATKFHEDLRVQMETLTSQIVEAHNDYLANWLAEHAPDLAEASRADGMASWVDLVLRGHEPDVALRMVRVKYPEPPPVPPDVQMMSMSSAGKVFRGQQNATVEQRIRELTPVVDWGV